MTILVVDDSAVSRQSISEYLKQLGHTVIPVQCGECALREASATKCDAAVMDIVLPDMDGTEVIKRLRKIAGWMFTPILVLTATSKKDLEEVAKNLEGVDNIKIMQKPQPFQVVINELEHLVRG